MVVMLAADRAVVNVTRNVVHILEIAIVVVVRARLIALNDVMIDTVIASHRCAATNHLPLAVIMIDDVPAAGPQSNRRSLSR